ncbi:SMI1/KNR4 family protein [Streptomyces indicus]|uniref:SMI1-KNR4 cell-wall n=1 Tax=Streptomyces indicus TaxID=417292 RepID=A0A1G9DAG1_9ACTN|nr:SMI1/KNR4 family protein [Streptomyces indicus]SDK60817.1 SMI1-KNR4 cell-wall [Streptomyces indicus]
MSPAGSVAALARLVPAPARQAETVDWAAVEAAWGTRFPSDYVRFMETYGPGTFGDTVVVEHPQPDVEGYPGGSGLDEETANARLTWEAEGDDAGFAVDPQDILAWGVTTGADIYCWVTTDEDPDRWPVLIWGRHTTPAFQLHPFGMTEFLRRLCGDAEFRKETVSVVLPEPVQFTGWRGDPDA